MIIVEWLLRFLIGGAVVSLFAALGDATRPKSFAGIFGAAPSVALATLALTVHSDGAAFAAIEARSMVVGAVAFFVYVLASSRVLWKGKYSPTLITVAGLALWLGVAIAGWLLVRGRV